MVCVCVCVCAGRRYKRGEGGGGGTTGVPHHGIGRALSTLHHRGHIRLVNLARSRGAGARAGGGVVRQPLDLVVVGVRACGRGGTEGVSEGVYEWAQSAIWVMLVVSVPVPGTMLVRRLAARAAVDAPPPMEARAAVCE